MKVLFATNNQNKLNEVQSLFPENVQLISLAEAGFFEDLPEPFETLEENARSKILAILNRSGQAVGFSEDSGLFIHALNGKPGVHSAHYAGPQRNDTDNINRVLDELKGQSDRRAFFQTTICLVENNKEYFFTGVCPGSIESSAKGNRGFGYDPIFRPAGSDLTFGEMDLKQKNQYSHRKKAVKQLVDFFHQTNKID